ncbi:glycoside hydrolase family 18 protein, partial [Acidaminococcus intestini]
MRKIIKILSGAVAAGVILLIAGAVSLMVPSTSAAKQRPQPSFDSNAWVAYWDYSRGLKEAKAVSSQLNSVSYFGGALDSQGKVIVLGPAGDFITEKLPRYKVTVKKYLTVVNDVYDDPQDPKSQTKVKDTAVLENLLATKESRQAHIDDLFGTMKKYGYDGLEIDYEQVWKNPLVAFRYVKFIQEIAAAADEQQIPLRIIFEPSVPANKLIFPEGPEYVIMSYNLYGMHTKEAGPKADKAFIDT